MRLIILSLCFLCACATVKEDFVKCTEGCERQGYIDLEQCQWKTGCEFDKCYAKQIYTEFRCVERKCYPIIYKE